VNSSLIPARNVVWLRQCRLSFVRWVVFIQYVARCYINVLITVSHVMTLATLRVSTLIYNDAKSWQLSFLSEMLILCTWKFIFSEKKRKKAFEEQRLISLWWRNDRFWLIFRAFLYPEKFLILDCRLFLHRRFLHCRFFLDCRFLLDCRLLCAQRLLTVVFCS
jgi:hypothetical protein